MTKEALVEEARKLPEPSQAAAEEFAANSEMLAAELNRIMTAREDLYTLIGPDNKEMMEDNHRNHARFMSSLLAHYDAEVLVNTVLWVFRAYRGHGFNLTYWPAQLDTWVTLLKRTLSKEAFESVYPVYHFMLVHQQDFAQLSEPALPTSGRQETVS